MDLPTHEDIESTVVALTLTGTTFTEYKPICKWLSTEQRYNELNTTLELCLARRGAKGGTSSCYYGRCIVFGVMKWED